MQFNVLIRCDASIDIGLGHISRCIVLANALAEKGGKVTFILHETMNMGRVFITKAGFDYRELLSDQDYGEQMKTLAHDLPVNLFIGDIRDGLPSSVIKYYKQQGILTVAIDEPSTYAEMCDLSFYPPHANLKGRTFQGKVFKGIQYLLLRQEFYSLKREPLKNKFTNILVMLGGTDAKNLALPLISQLLHEIQAEDCIYLILRKDHPDMCKLKSIDSRVVVKSEVENMARFLLKIDWAIISFGVAAYELLIIGIPAVHVCLNREHQMASEWFVRHGYAMNAPNMSLEELTLPPKTFRQLPMVSMQIASTIIKHLKFKK